LQATDPFVEDGVGLAEREADQRPPSIDVVVEHRRSGTAATPTSAGRRWQNASPSSYPSGADVDGDEVGARRGTDVEADLGEPLAEPVAAGAVGRCEVLEVGVVEPERRRPRVLERGPVGEGEELLRRAHGPVRAGGAQIQPIFHPVTEKVLAADEMTTVRSRIPGNVASGTVRPVVDEVLVDLVGDRDEVVLDAQRSATSSSSLSVNTLPSGCAGSSGGSAGCGA
jgi:hypothetical protein